MEGPLAALRLHVGRYRMKLRALFDAFATREGLLTKLGFRKMVRAELGVQRPATMQQPVPALLMEFFGTVTS